MKDLIIISFIILVTIIYNCDCRKKENKINNYNDNDDYYMEKDSSNPLNQLFVKGKDETPQSFIRLVLMRLLYGLAAQFGYEERLSGLFNGAFVPPNADDDTGLFGGDFDDGGGLLDIFDL